MHRGASVTCDRCENAYTPVVAEQALSGGAVQLAMTCPHCSAIYPIARISETGVRLRHRLHRLQRLRLGRTPQYRAVHDRFQKQVTRMATVERERQAG